MNRYLMSIETKSLSFHEFEIQATDEEDAIFVARQFASRNSPFSGGNYDLDTIRIVKKKGES